METMRVARVSSEAVAGPDPSWRELYRAGDVAGLLVDLIYIIAAILIFSKRYWV